MITKLLSSLTLAATLAFASAAGTVAIDDGGIDYADSDIESVFVQFDFAGGELQLTLVDAAMGALPSVQTWVPEATATDWRGDAILPTLADLDNIELVELGRDAVGFTLLHQETDVDALAASYREALGALGFEATLEHEGMNSATYTFTQGDETLRAIFGNEGYGMVEAYLRFL